MDDLKLFQEEKLEYNKKMREDNDVKNTADAWMRKCIEYKYYYSYSWMGIPIIQQPDDIILTQEIVYKVKPDLIIETGIARGGSVIFYASLLELLSIGNIDYKDGLVLGIDIDIRKHNRTEIEKHPMIKRIKMLEGSSISPEIAQQVKEVAKGKKTIMLSLDSNHTHSHVLKELELYAPLVSVGSTIIVWDTISEFYSELIPSDRPWSKGNNPNSALNEFLKNNDSFVIDEEFSNRAILTCAPRGFLKRIK